MVNDEESLLKWSVTDCNRFNVELRRVRLTASVLFRRVKVYPMFRGQTQICEGGNGVTTICSGGCSYSNGSQDREFHLCKMERV